MSLDRLSKVLFPEPLGRPLTDSELVLQMTENTPMSPPMVTDCVPPPAFSSKAPAFGEIRITDPDTGGQKGQKDAQLGAMCPRSIMEVAKVAAFGGKKYARYNFLKGFQYSLAYDALQRHAHAFWAGEDKDPESGLPHMAHCAWQALCLVAFQLRGIGKDDRPL